MRICFIAAIALAMAAPAAAQEWLVARERFAFVGTRLTIDVNVQSPGTLRLIRGESGRVRVAGRSLDGFTASGLDGRRRLTLTAAGAGRVDYLVAVPEGVWVSVRLPDRDLLESVGGHDVGRTFDWQGTTVARPVADAPPPLPDDPYASLYTTYDADYAPAVIDVPDLSVVRSVTVRIEGTRFRVASSRPLSVSPGSVDQMEIRPAGPPMDLAITVPPGTPRFTLRAAGTPALTIDGETATALCLPFAEQRLSGNRRWFTFTPVEGRLQCQADLRQRQQS